MNNKYLNDTPIHRKYFSLTRAEYNDYSIKYGEMENDSLL